MYHESTGNGKKVMTTQYLSGSSGVHGWDAHIGALDFPDLADVEPVVGDEGGVAPVVGPRPLYHQLLEAFWVGFQVGVLEPCADL